MKDYSSFDSPRNDCVLFVSLMKLNSESFAAKNVLLMSLVKVNTLTPKSRIFTIYACLYTAYRSKENIGGYV